VTRDEEGEDAEDKDYFEETEQIEMPDEEEDGEVRCIKFSRDRDLQRYRSASRPGAAGGNPGDKMDLGKDAPAPLPGYHGDSQGLGQGPGYEGRVHPFPAEEAPETSDEEDGEGNIFGRLWGWGALQIIPAIIFLLIIVVLALTFISGSIPDFRGLWHHRS